jgi:selenide,water dikinase
MKHILCDAQTSGGLLIAVHPDDARSCLSELHQNDVTSATIIGSIKEKGKGRIKIV